MNTEKYSKADFMQMDSMHDCYATQISIENNTLIVIYDNLDEGVLRTDGLPYYKNKRLVINYEFDSFCDAKFYCRKGKYEIVDLLKEKGRFDKLTNNCIFSSYKYSVDSFGEITLHFDIRKVRNDKLLNNKHWGLEISTDAKEITYSWE